MKFSQLKKYFPIVVMLSFIITISFFFSRYSADYLIETVGNDNAYILMFALAFAGGLSTFSGVPYHLVLIALAAGGLNPLYLGIVTAVGVSIGDSTSYFIGYEGRAILPNGIQKFFQKLIDFFMKRKKFLPIFFFLYGSLAPFSNDFIVISMGYARYPFWRVMIPIGLGNVVFNTMLAVLAIYSYSFLQGIFF